MWHVTKTQTPPKTERVCFLYISAMDNFSGKMCTLTTARMNKKQILSTRERICLFSLGLFYSLFS